MPLRAASNSKLRDYALEPGTLKTALNHRNRDGSKIWRTTIKAIWCRRTSGVLVATTGTLMSFHRQERRPDMSNFLSDWHSRISPDWIASWDGTLSRTARAMPSQEQAAAIAELESVLASYPDPPPGYTCWYRPAEIEESLCIS